MVMFREEDKKVWLWFVIPFLTGYFLLYFLGYRVSYMGSAGAIWLTFFAWCIFLLGYWEDKKELIKRCLLALPVGFLTIFASSFTFLGLYRSIPAGIVIFMWLTAAKRKHFVFTLIVGGVILVFLYLQLILSKYLLEGTI